MVPSIYYLSLHIFIQKEIIQTTTPSILQLSRVVCIQQGLGKESLSEKLQSFNLPLI